MSRRWVVIAHRAGARFFEYDREAKSLSLVEEISHPEGRRRDRELETDRPGQAFASAGRGGGHPMPVGERAHERAAADFARDVAGRIRGHRNDNRFGELVLVAEPGFLGLLQGALDKASAALVTDTVTKDLAHVEGRDLGPHLSQVIDVRPEERLQQARR